MRKHNQNKADRKTHVVSWMMIGFILGVIVGMVMGVTFVPAIGMCFGIFIGAQLDMREKKMMYETHEKDPTNITIHMV
ncbi:MAG TPA: hypothetical protein DCY42_09030 [Chloroflexi bacterium]|nr:hypothetical protein [Chloroflexota bacterium]